MIHLPVIIVITEETTSRHINVLLFFLLFLLLLLLLLLSSSRSSTSGGGSTSSGNGDELLKSFLDQLLNVLSLQISNQLLDLLILSLSTDGLKDVLDVSSLHHQTYPNQFLQWASHFHPKQGAGKHSDVSSTEQLVSAFPLFSTLCPSPPAILLSKLIPLYQL